MDHHTQMCVGMCMLSTDGQGGQNRALAPPGTTIIGSCEPTDTGTAN